MMDLVRTRFLPQHMQPILPDFDKTTLWGNISAKLWETWGDPYWWPGDSAWNVAVGAVLTQNTAWINVEHALLELEDSGVTTPESILDLQVDELAGKIQSSGYYNQKARKLKFLATWWQENVPDVTDMLTQEQLRTSLLDIWGIGPETADSIACYSFGKPLFVVDAYTQRFLQRYNGSNKKLSYNEVQQDVHTQLPRDTFLYNVLHGLLVVLGKEYCKARKPVCESCPFTEGCQKKLSR